MPRRARAVLFDLYNTLVPGGSRDERDRVSGLVAGAIGVEPEAMASLVRRTFDDRCRGRLGGLEETIRAMARSLGADPSADAVDEAVRLRLEMTRALIDQGWGTEVLDALRRRGVLRGVVTDCSAETPEVWPDCALSRRVDAVSFSCVTGVRKPDAEAYLVAVRALGVRATDCLYVGDGGSRELSGAEALGMRAIRFVPPGDLPVNALDADPGWSGPAISDLTDLVWSIDEPDEPSGGAS